MDKQTRKNLIQLVAASALVLLVAVGVEYQWDYFTTTNQDGPLQAQVPEPPTTPPTPPTGGLGAPLDLAPLPDVIFADVSADHPNARAIFEMKQRGIMAGRDDGTFRPDQNLIKAETLVVSMRAAGIEADPDDPPAGLNDLDQNQWFAPWVNTAFARGIIQGDRDGNFNPTKVTNMAEFFVMTTGALGVNLFAYEPQEEDAIWYQVYVNYAEWNGLVDGDFVANQDMTRAIGAETLWRIFIQQNRV
jgi:hypothetical protein